LSDPLFDATPFPLPLKRAEAIPPLAFVVSFVTVTPSFPTTHPAGENTHSNPSSIIHGFTASLPIRRLPDAWSTYPGDGVFVPTQSVTPLS
jgi:hypothetical protein